MHMKLCLVHPDLPMRIFERSSRASSICFWHPNCESIYWKQVAYRAQIGHPEKPIGIAREADPLVSETQITDRLDEPKVGFVRRFRGYSTVDGTWRDEHKSHI